ncbi:MAG: hypothetical protein F4046_00420 [Acidimicrobiaceae bacterium]|nr:hypothetical protein [Acidimicrobiaceae bacterium]
MKDGDAMEAPGMPEESPSRYGLYELGPYPSTIVNRGALPEGFFFWRRWRPRKPVRLEGPSRYGLYELGPYPSTIVNRGALPEGFFFWRRWRRRKPV